MDSQKVPKSRRKSQIRATNKFVREHYDRIGFNLPKGEKDRWNKEAANLGFDNLKSFIVWAVEKQIGSIKDCKQSNCTTDNNDIE